MVLENKLGITDSVELARAEEKISKRKALELFELHLLNTFEVGSFEGLAKIHKYLFDEIVEKYVEKGKSMQYNEFCNCGNFWKCEKEGQTYEHQN